MRTPSLPARRIALVAGSILVAAACGGGDRRARAGAPDTVAGSAAAARMRCTDGAALSITSRGIGPVILGGRVAALRARCPVRDTTWESEGMPETGVVVDADGVPLLAVTTGTRDSTVSRIVAWDPAPRTAMGTGVGSSVAELREKHGRLCAAIGEGIVVAHVAGGSGIAFALTIPAGALPRGDVSAHPELVPDSAHVATVWVHEGETSCGGT